MDPLSIAAAAASISATCFKLANTIYEYVEEVKDVSHDISLFGTGLENSVYLVLNTMLRVLKKHSEFSPENLVDSPRISAKK